MHIVTIQRNVLFLHVYSWKGGNGFSTRMVSKLQITRGKATSDFLNGPGSEKQFSGPKRARQKTHRN
jgi:hypothetical protein